MTHANNLFTYDEGGVIADFPVLMTIHIFSCQFTSRFYIIIVYCDCIHKRVVVATRAVHSRVTVALANHEGSLVSMVREEPRSY